MELLLIVIAIALAAVAVIVVASLAFARYVMRIESPLDHQRSRWLQHAAKLEERGRHYELHFDPGSARQCYAAASAARRQAAAMQLEEAARHGSKHA